MNKPYGKETYFALTLDPVHIGTGGYRLGRVDNTITREPGTNLPKIPGTGISGVTRAFTAMAVQDGTFVEIDTNFTIDYEKYRKCKYQRPAYQFLIDENKKRAVVKTNSDKKPFYEGKDPHKEKYYSCAGKGADDGKGHCGEPDCEVCVAFGFSKDANSFQGMAQFFDARILFFPVYSMIGPVWITSESIIGEFKVNGATLTDKSKFKRFDAAIKVSENNLNLGWLMLEGENGTIAMEKTEVLKEEISCIPKEIKERLILVSDNLFSHIVNDNLEVRTSVAIDPATGAAEDGALYTYEAIPRATVLWFDVVYNKPENFRINGQDIMKDDKNKADWEWVKENVEKGLKLIEFMGVGGMNTRGMGRMKILNLEV